MKIFFQKTWANKGWWVALLLAQCWWAALLVAVSCAPVLQ